MSDVAKAHTYRPDIDGLRAIAVLSVIIYHAKDTLLPGGFLGVDIFFVISGYLISKHIASEVTERRFSLIEFYRRRIRRIVPMMLTVVAATLVVSLFFMTPEDARAVAKSAVWSIASMANIHFWRDLDTGYFANSSAEIPLLHLWSLGVEEQFYLIWPLILMWGVRWIRPVALLALMAILAGMSFELAARTFPTDASFAYYMLPTRMGELVVGAIAGVAAVITPWRLSPVAARVAGWTGLTVVGVCLFAINAEDPFPGWSALAPTVGAALLIIAGENRHRSIPGLASRPMVFVGTLSYSAYLWHWPLFAFFRYGYGEPGLVACLALIAATLLLAWISLEWVERPTRSTTLAFAAVFRRQFALPAAAVVLPALVVIYAHRIGVPLASDTYLSQLAAVKELTRPAFTHDWVCQRQRLEEADLANPKCVLGSPEANSSEVILWGDSNAAHYVPMVKAFADHAGFQFRNVAVGACPPLLTDPTPYVDARRASDCIASSELVRNHFATYRTVILAAAWASYVSRSAAFMDDLERLILHLQSRGQTVVLIGNAPIISTFDRRCREKALRVPLRHCDVSDVPLTSDVTDVNQRLRALTAQIRNARYFDGNGFLCPENRCAQLTLDNKPRYIDQSHLSVAGSSEMGAAILKSEGIPEAFKWSEK
ncbi:acyltransferase family protein [Comamonadaceae bacterium G21597-S1]|nr:acyltransferase family protein [Comamonadaceae bacterium G21597-S1]